MKPGNLRNGLVRAFSSLWRDFTTPKWHSAWEQLRRETDAELRPPGFLRPGQLRIRHRSFVIVLTTWDSGESRPGTAFQTRLQNASNLTFSIHVASVVRDALGHLGNSWIQSGDHAFDETFRVSGNNRAKIAELLQDTTIRDSLRQNKGISMSLVEKPIHKSGHLTRSTGDGPYELTEEVDQVITDVDQLRQMLALHRRVLDSLERMGIATAIETP